MAETSVGVRVDALRSERHVLDHLLERIAAMVERSRKPMSEQAIGQEQAGDDRKGRSHHAPDEIDQDGEPGDADDEIERGELARANDQLLVERPMVQPDQRSRRRRRSSRRRARTTSRSGGWRSSLRRRGRESPHGWCARPGSACCRRTRGRARRRRQRQARPGRRRRCCGGARQARSARPPRPPWRRPRDA